MDVLFLVPMINAGSIFSHGVQYLSASLVEHGIDHEIYILDECEKDGDLAPLLEVFRGSNPRLVACTCTSFELSFVNQVIRELREHYEFAAILGGVHAIISPETIYDTPFDYFCTAEADNSFWRFCRKYLDGDDPLLPGYRDRARCNADTPEMVLDLEDLPDYRKGKLPLRRILDERNGWLNAAITRGCSHNCGFCINPLLRDRFPGKGYVRRLTPRAAIEYLKGLLVHIGGVKIINFDDDNLAGNRAWIEEFLWRYDRDIWQPYAIGYVLNARASDITEELVERFVETGCHELQMSVETGSEFVRNTLLGKGITDHHLIRAYGWCNEYGLRTLSYIMHGLPHATGDEAQITADLIKRLQPTMIRATYFYPFPGTALRRICEQDGIEFAENPSTMFDEPVLPHGKREKEEFMRALDGLYAPCERNPHYLEKLHLGHSDHIQTAGISTAMSA